MTNTTNIDTHATKSWLLYLAQAQVAKYPQYTNHFANYRLARIKRDVKTKFGTAFVAGEYCLAKPVEFVVPGTPVFVTAWSNRTEIDTSVKLSDLEWVIL